ncbi:protein kinase [Allosaccharopolyspora coralli]|uniref:non-specific serine/threonine protein kinase n=1 Tax=Allosaccharopolyspora coralli TaxID=2665642 RepID=A0A5Q3Q3X7_9PSEU|nr:serine/threonine-protein kinase [Allosaccharopolyspora coralli]QGK68530.1 protein kinase [Allosaccharopolyspora coralli]
MSEDLTGRRLGQYKIDEALGKGGMSVLYRATDVRLGRKVALKVMGEHITGDTEFRERFVDEARNTAAIDHANVVPLYDFGEIDGMLYIAMRLVEGSDLAHRISDGAIAPQRALELLDQIAGALDTLHEQGLVHLDLKPANVLVTDREAAAEHVYLADFGLTRRGATGHRTSSGDFLGSPTYAAPEHLRGEPVDGRTDLYALACMLFACLTGRPPFQGDVQQVIQGHLNTEPPAVTSQVVLPSSIDDVLRRGMAKQADRRYGTCKELLAAARTALSAVARPEVPPPARPTGPSAPQHRTPPQYVPQPQAPPPQAAGYRPPGPQPGPPQGYAPAYRQSRPLPPPGQDPVRLRPPMPAQSAAPLARRSSGNARWVVPLMVVGAVLVLVVIFIVMATSGGSGSSSPEPSSSYETSEFGQVPTVVPTVGGG